MRLNFRSSTRASVATSSVLARPGTPTMRLLPPTNSVVRISSMTSLCPMMRLPSSAMICCRPTFILSANAMSSGDSNSTVSSATTVPLSQSQSSVAACNCRLPTALVCHPVNDVIHAEFVRFVRLVDGLEPRVGELPVLRDVRVEVHHHQQPLRRVVVLEDPAEDRPARVVVLRNDVEIIDLEEGMKDRMRGVEIDEPRARQHAQHLRLAVVPAAAPLRDVVEDHQAALREV